MNNHGVNVHAHGRGVCHEAPPDGSLPASSVALSGPASRPQPSACMASSSAPPPMIDVQPGGQDRTLHLKAPIPRPPATSSPPLAPMSRMSGSPTGPQRADLPPGRWNGPTGGLYHSPRGKDETPGSAFIIGTKSSRPWPRADHREGNRAERSWRAKRVARARAVGEAMLQLKSALRGRLHGSL